MKPTIAFYLAASIWAVTLGAYAQDNQNILRDPIFKGDEEVGAVVVTGNTSADTYNLKLDNAYTAGRDTFAVVFNYVETRTFDDHARFWDNTIRYDRMLRRPVSGFIDEKWESDQRSGFTQRTSTDLGSKCYFYEGSPQILFAELGYRYTDMLQDFSHTHSNYVRVYGEWSRKTEKKMEFKVWAEFLENITQKGAYLFNYEESLSMVLTDILSLKMAYLTRYQAIVLPGLYNTDTTTTVALVAKF